jgi:hypothetical protein
LSEFIHQLKERLKAARHAKSGLQQDVGEDGRFARLKNQLHRVFRSLHLSQGSRTFDFSPVLSTVNALNPSAVAKSLSFLFIVLLAGILIYWLMRMAQIPGVPSTPPSGISKGFTLYTNQDGASAYSLFGSKPLVTDNIFLRGVVATSKTVDGRLDGFAIFEIDGKSTNAISVGENLGKGLTLQSIGEESATLLYEGNKLDFKLSKAGAKKK